MKSQYLFACVAALATSMCHAVDLPKPLTITFYEKDKESSGWADVVGSKNVDDGQSAHEADPSYWGHYKFTSTEDPMRKFYWEQPSGAITCKTMISGDPKIEDLIYHLDTRTFEYQGEPDLSVIHVRCEFESPRSNADDNADIKGSYYNYKPPPVLSLNDTDLEQPLTVIFQISEWPEAVDGALELQTIKDRLNQDFLWTALPDKSMSTEEKAYEEFYSKEAIVEYKTLWEIAKEKQALPEDQSYQPSMWSGEVGRMVFARPRSAPRAFMWTLHNDQDIAKKCYLNVNRDPHASKVYIGMDGDEPKVTLNVTEAGGPLWPLDTDLPGDSNAVTVTCDKPPVDDRAD